jgi:peptidoglycan/xylan/chitin deacetylase (PgdA/CDA1 family)
MLPLKDNALRPAAFVRTKRSAAYNEPWSVPILMYHRIADDGPETLSRYRIAPAAFETQMNLLRGQGYRTITSRDLDRSIRSRQLPTGRFIMLTFDDGNQDFLEAAWPVLCQLQFTAEVFVVTSKVGTVADWDRKYGPPASLMTWNSIRALHAQGICFGSHTANHVAASRLTFSALRRETEISRTVLQQQLGCEVLSFAAPHGTVDQRLMRCVTAAGYRTAFTTENRAATLFDDPLLLPRLEVSGGQTIEEFAKRIGTSSDDATC